MLPRETTSRVLTLADVALYAYTHAAEEGGIGLGDDAAVRAWLDRVAGQPVHVPMLSG